MSSLTDSVPHHLMGLGICGKGELGWGRKIETGTGVDENGDIDTRPRPLKPEAWGWYCCSSCISAGFWEVV